MIYHTKVIVIPRRKKKKKTKTKQKNKTKQKKNKNKNKTNKQNAFKTLFKLIESLIIFDVQRYKFVLTFQPVFFDENAMVP